MQAAVNETVKTFGGIDICVNNASAISLTPATQTDMKRYDLMHGINARGTFLVSRNCIPHLKKGTNPHILMLSPPLDMSPKWFAPHVAYSMAKFNMSIIALGLSGELKGDGIAANTLWPRTTIATAAVQEPARRRRTDQAQPHAGDHGRCGALILTQDAKTFTGSFCIDDTLLYEHGVRTSRSTASTRASNLAPDFFVPDSIPPPPGVRLPSGCGDLAPSPRRSVWRGPGNSAGMQTGRGNYHVTEDDPHEPHHRNHRHPHPPRAWRRCGASSTRASAGSPRGRSC